MQLAESRQCGAELGVDQDLTRIVALRGLGPHGDRATLEVHVGPAQRRRLAPTQAGGEERVPQGILRDALLALPAGVRLSPAPAGDRPLGREMAVIAASSAATAPRTRAFSSSLTAWRTLRRYARLCGS
jgi:hypothetical protein